MTIMPAEEHLDVRVVVHTHWDREWYQPEPRFRQRLVALVDELLDRSAPAPFLLDGQAVLLEDYLGVRPERAADLSAALRSEAIEAGPWFVLADELTPSAEGLVRNLLAGRRVLQALRASPPAVLYCPDAFGHPACLPALASGFGFATIVLWRGFGGQAHPAGDTARWIAPDGSSAIIHHLPPDGYEFGSHLPVEPTEAATRWQRTAGVLGSRSATGVVMLTVGADHHAPQSTLDQALDTTAQVAQPQQFRRDSLGGFARALVDQVAGRSLPTVSGELRDSYGYTWTLQGTFGARAALKRRYTRAERTLLRDVEPWIALASRQDGRDRRHLLRSAWRPLLLCQPHDTLCGTAVDEVALAFRQRVDEARTASDELQREALMALAGHDPDGARDARDAWRPAIVVRNPSAHVRSGVAELDVDVLLAESPVGPGSASVPVRARRAGAASIGDPAIPIQELERSRRFVREESARAYPRNLLVEHRRVVAWVNEVPAYGLVALPVRGRTRARPVAPASVSGDDRSISSGSVRVGVAGDGLAYESGGHRIDDWIGIEGEGERGDLYTGSSIPGTLARASLVRARVTAAGPLRAELVADWRLSLPARRLTSAAGVPRRVPGSSLRVRTTIQLDAGCPGVRILVRGSNDTTDVRLRVVLRTALPDANVFADAGFGPVHRVPVVAERAEHLPESVPPTDPLHRYVTLSGPTRSVTVFSDGLPEVECSRDDTVAVTLFRAVGELSRHDLPERPGHAGYPGETPAAQERGPFAAALAFAVHGPRSDGTIGAIERLADDVLHPLTGATWRTAIDAPTVIHGAELTGDGLAFSAIKPSEDGEWTVLRCVNLLDREVAGNWCLAGAREARLARLDETPLGVLQVADGVIPFEAPPRGVVTVLAR
jgi:alpha-mannosidase